MTAKKPPADPAADKPKKSVDQATLDRLAAGRAKRAESVAAKKTGTPPAATPPPAPKKDAPATRPERCMACYCRPCDGSGKRCKKS